MYVQLLLGITVLFVPDFWLYWTAPAIGFCFHICNSTGHKRNITPDGNSLLCRGPHKGLLIQNKLAIPDDQFLDKSTIHKFFPPTY